MLTLIFSSAFMQTREFAAEKSPAAGNQILQFKHCCTVLRQLIRLRLLLTEIR